MSATSRKFSIGGIRCYYRPLILGAATIALLCLFWFTSRYPQLLAKSQHVGEALPSMAYSHEILRVAENDPAWRKILYSSVNWLDGMKIGMTFGVLFGALLHTYLRYYPLKIGKNLYLNSLKGALIGVPMGVCANCSVPVACGVTRGHGRIEVALGFLFSSPNFNPVVVMMTFMAFPLAMSLTKYALLLFVILVVVPGMVSLLERKNSLKPLTVGTSESCALPIAAKHCTEPFWGVFKELGWDYARNAWMLIKPTITLMVLASIASSAMIVLIPWNALLSNHNPLVVPLVSLISVFMPVPIALDVMFAAQLQQQGVSSGYVMLFMMTLGTYSIIPSIYLWRDVSKRLAVMLFAFFMAVGWIVGLLF